MPICSILAGVGGYLPERIVTNDELARTVDTSDQWIRERTGIRQRHFAGPHETATFMGTAAAREALAHAKAEPAEVDAVILATSTPDQAFPSTAIRVMAALGIPDGFGFDLSAACAGSAARSTRAFSTGGIAAPAYCSATARVRCSCAPAPAAAPIRAFSAHTCIPRAPWATSSTSTAPSDSATNPGTSS
jgi:hypothetical protein